MTIAATKILSILFKAVIGQLFSTLALLLMLTSNAVGQNRILVPSDSGQLGIARIADIEIVVPDLTVVGEPELAGIEIDVPPLVVVGEPAQNDLVIEVPDLIIVGEPKPEDIEIEVPALIIVGEPDEDQKDQNKERSTDQIDVTTRQTDATSAEQGEEINSEPMSVKDWCIGNYTAHFGVGTGTAAGFVAPFGQNHTVPVQVEPNNCQAALLVTIEGQAVKLLRDGYTRTYSGSINMGDGATRVLTLSCDTDFELRGALAAFDGDIKVERPVWMLRQEREEAQLERLTTSCE